MYIFFETVILHTSWTTVSYECHIYIHWETRKFIWFTLLRYKLYCSGLEPRLWYLRGMPLLISQFSGTSFSRFWEMLEPDWWLTFSGKSVKFHGMHVIKLPNSWNDLPLIFLWFVRHLNHFWSKAVNRRCVENHRLDRW